MDASTRLYQRLAEIPEDPDDPESLDDLIVCAFGAFERYYVCWKTKGGDYRQDGHDLPPALNDWLYPIDGTTRDFATLQVVFGRGEEYFASDKNGKLEYKEPEVKKIVEEEEKIDRMALRRSRTVSFLRPLSETSVKSDATSADSLASRQSRSSSVSSQRASRPPSLSYSRTNSDASSVLSRPNSRPLSIISSHTRAQSSLSSQWAVVSENLGEQNSLATTTIETNPPKSSTAVLKRTSTGSPSKYHTQPPSWPQQPTTPPPPPTHSTPTDPQHSPSPPTQQCTCTCTPHPHPPRPNYTNASVQTDETLYIDNTAPWSAQPSYSYSYSAAFPPDDDETSAVMVGEANPLVVGRSLDYFSKPGYQLGDSLSFGGLGVGALGWEEGGWR
ncbi:hypothetical protein J1614_010310, partial [Plenodomus biglobosus]